MSRSPLILGLISDVFFSAPLTTTLKTLGYQAHWIERGDELEAPDLLPHSGAHLGEPLTGRGATFIRQVVEWQPALILVELNSTSIPWGEWIAALKSSAATRRIPVVAFGPHTDLELRARALDVGCDAVIAKGRFLSALPELVAKYVRVVDEDALTQACEEPLSARAREGVELFNHRDFFEAHEELELAWKEDPGPARELYRAILQVAVAYLQIERRNYNGALKMFLRMRQWLDPLPEHCRGVAVAQLRADALTAQQALETLGAERIAEFDRDLFKPVVIL